MRRDRRLLPEWVFSHAMSRRVTLSLLGVLAVGILGAAAGWAQESDGERQRLLTEGRVVYDANCMVCHQADGAGVPGAFPPLAGNERATDASYVAQIVRQGLQGEIVVAGVTYDGVMLPLSALSDEEVAAVAAYVAEGLNEPPAPPPVDGSDAAAGDGEGDAGALVGLVTLVVLVVLLVASLTVLRPYIARSRSDREFTHTEAYLKSALIVLYFVISTVVIPAAIVEWGYLAEPPSPLDDAFSAEGWATVRDLIGTGLWLAALALGIWMLRRLQRNRVI